MKWWCDGRNLVSNLFSRSSEQWALLRYCKVSKVSKWGIAKYPSAVQCRDVAAVWYERAKCRSRGFWAVHRMRSVDLWHNVHCIVYIHCLALHCVTLECSILWRAPGVWHCVSGSYQVCQIISTSQAGTRGRSGREKGGDVFRHLDLIVFHFIMCFTSSCVSPHGVFQFLLTMCFATWISLCFTSWCVSPHGSHCDLMFFVHHWRAFMCVQDGLLWITHWPFMNHSLTSYESLTDLLWITHPPAKVNLSNTRRRCCITRGLIVSLTVNSHRELMILLIVFGHYCFCILTVPWLRCCWRLFVLTQGGIFVMLTDCFLHREGNICISYNCGQR